VRWGPAKPRVPIKVLECGSGTWDEHDHGLDYPGPLQTIDFRVTGRGHERIETMFQSGCQERGRKFTAGRAKRPCAARSARSSRLPSARYPQIGARSDRRAAGHSGQPRASSAPGANSGVHSSVLISARNPPTAQPFLRCCVSSPSMGAVSWETKGGPASPGTALFLIRRRAPRIARTRRLPRLAFELTLTFRTVIPFPADRSSAVGALLDGFGRRDARLLSHAKSLSPAERFVNMGSRSNGSNRPIADITV